MGLQILILRSWIGLRVPTTLLGHGTVCYAGKVYRHESPTPAYPFDRRSFASECTSVCLLAK